jgi:hypothetical protein
MSQKDQVIAALEKIGGKGTNTEILRVIDTKKWKTKTPDATVSANLYTLSKENLCKKVGKYWILIKDAKRQTLVKSVDNNLENGLYLITLSDQTKKHVSGFAFKVGSASKGIRRRLRNYNALLPFVSI